MTHRIRSTGPRRRMTGATLVRSVPAVKIIPPPIPLSGYIRRVMTATAISDYAVISDTNWASGQTGNVVDQYGTSQPNTNMNAIYHYYTTTNMRTTSKQFLMAPIRWSAAAPAANLGSYDFWTPFGGAVASARATVGSSAYPQHYLGNIGITNTLLPTGSHVAWQDGVAQVFPLMYWTGVARRTNANFTDFNLTNFQALNPTYQIWNTGRGYSGGIDPLANHGVYAIQHRVNGVAVGGLILNPTTQNNRGTEWRRSIAPDDVYELDVWYKLQSTAFENNSAAPGKACAYIPTSLVHNNSKLITPQECLFYNVDFSPSFNYQSQTYEVTVSGHSGWTLKDGSNGPHKMISSNDWKATISNGSIIWEKIYDNDYCRAIVLRWDREIAHVEFYRGPLLDTSVSAGPVFYRIDDSNTVYRSSTTSVVDGTITHATPGLFNQAGTSVFKMVPWTYDSAASQPANETPAAEGKKSGLLSLFLELPTTITLTRTTL